MTIKQFYAAMALATLIPIVFVGLLLWKILGQETAINVFLVFMIIPFSYVLAHVLFWAALQINRIQKYLKKKRGN